MRKIRTEAAPPRFRKKVATLDECLEIYRVDERKFLADAVAIAFSRDQPASDDLARMVGDAGHECGLALYKAISTYNEHRRRYGIIGGRDVPDYEIVGVSEPFDKLQPLEGVKAKRPSKRSKSKKIVERIKNSPTENGKLKILAEQAGKLAEQLDELNSAISFVSQMGMIDYASKRIEAKDDKERAKLRAVLREEIALLVEQNRFRGIQNILTRLADYNDPGGTPGYVFQRGFLEPLIPLWHGWKGKPPASEDKDFLGFVASAYYVFSDDGFEQWESVLKTALKNYGKTPMPKH